MSRAANNLLAKKGRLLVERERLAATIRRRPARRKFRFQRSPQVRSPKLGESLVVAGGRQLAAALGTVTRACTPTDFTTIGRRSQAGSGNRERATNLTRLQSEGDCEPAPLRRNYLSPSVVDYHGRRESVVHDK